MLILIGVYHIKNMTYNDTFVTSHDMFWEKEKKKTLSSFL